MEDGASDATVHGLPVPQYAVLQYLHQCEDLRCGGDMRDRRAVQQAIVSGAVAASVIALAAACGSLFVGEQGPTACGDAGLVADAVVGAGNFSGIPDDYTFDPMQVTISTGESVCWEIIDGVSHTVTPTSGGMFGGTIDANNRTVIAIFPVVGDYTYSCDIHSGMGGVVHVRS